MSQSPQSSCSARELSEPSSSMLNTEALSFSPYSPRRSALRASAPPLVALVPPMLKDLSVPSFDAFMDNNDYSMNQPGGLQGASDWAIAPANGYDGDDIVDFSNFGQVTEQPRDDQGGDNGFVMQQPRGVHDLGNELTVDKSGVGECMGGPHVLGEPSIVQSIEVDYDLSRLRDIPGSGDYFYIFHADGTGSIDRSPSGPSGVSGEDNSAIDGEYETDDEYVYPPASPSQGLGDLAAQYPTPELDLNAADDTADSDASSSRLTNAKTHRGKNGSARPDRTQKNTCAKSSTTDAGVKKATNTRPLSDKMLKATAVIAKQKTKTNLAQRLGQHVHVVRNNGRVSIEGVYWTAPKNDATIPVTHAAKTRRVRTLVAAILNNEGCKEVSTTTAFLNRWGDGAEHFTKEELEDAAWQIVDTMIDIHTNGWSTKILDMGLRDLIQKTMFCTFEDRFVGLVQLLQYSKRTCGDLLKMERFFTIIGNPFALDKRTSSNAVSNKTKGCNLKEVVKVKKRAAAEMEQQVGGGGSEEEVASRPIKRARMVRV